MKEIEFIETLRRYLRTLSEKDRNEIIVDYQEHFRRRKEQGYSDEEISSQLGSPRVLAGEFVAQNFYETGIQKVESKEEKKKEKSVKLLSKILSLGFIWLILIFPIGIGILATIFSLLISGYALIIGSIVILATYIFQGSSGFLVSSFPYNSTVLAFIAIGALGIVFIVIFQPIMVAATKMAIAITKFTFTSKKGI